MTRLLGLVLALVIAGPIRTLTPMLPAQTASGARAATEAPDPWANITSGRAWIDFGYLTTQGSERKAEGFPAFKEVGFKSGVLEEWAPQQLPPAEGSMIKLLAMRPLIIHNFGRQGEDNIDTTPGIPKLDLPDYTGGKLMPQSEFSIVKVLKVTYGPPNPQGRSAVWVQVGKVTLPSP